VDPVLLRQLHADPDHRGDHDPGPQTGPGGVAAQPVDLVGDEEVLEHVREDQQERTPLRLLERDDADEPVEVQEPGHPHGRLAGPVPQRREVGDGQVVDVHRLVVALIAGRVVPERLEDRLVDTVEHQRTEDRRHREAGNEQRHEEPGTDDNQEDGGLHANLRRVDGIAQTLRTGACRERPRGRVPA
jgi:hypothetical protein